MASWTAIFRKSDLAKVVVVVVRVLVAMKCLHGSGFGVRSHHQATSFGKAEVKEKHAKMANVDVRNRKEDSMIKLLFLSVAHGRQGVRRNASEKLIPITLTLLASNRRELGVGACPKLLSSSLLISVPISIWNSSFTDCVAYGLKFLEAFSTEVLKPAEAGILSKARTPTINFVLGGPGVGKGTQCTRIAETFGFTHLSVGDLLRKEISSNTEDGEMILETIAKGKIVSSEVTVKLLKSVIESGETDKFLIDGFPRSEENRVAYEQIIGIEPEVVLFFDCNEEEMMYRVLHRRIDDNIDTTKERLKVFEAHTLPVIRYYTEKGKLYKDFYASYGPAQKCITKDRLMPLEQKMRFLSECDLSLPSSHRGCPGQSPTNPQQFWGLNMAPLKCPQACAWEGSNSCQILNTFCFKKNTNNKKQNQQKHNQISKFSLPKSKPSPPQLLTYQKPSPRTKLQALANVVDDLEASIKNGVNIDDPRIFSSLLETCFQLQAVEHGFRIHRLIPLKLLRRNVGVSSKLLRLYASNGYIEEAHQVFDYMSERNSSAFAWNSLISGYSELDGGRGCRPDGFTFPRVLKACGGLGLIHVGEAVHREIVRRGYGEDGFVLNGLVDMYAKCGDIVRARKVFDKMPARDLVSWNSMLTGYVKHELLYDATVVFRRMIRDGYDPDSISISTILTAKPSLKLVSEIHGWVLRKGIEWSLPIANSLVFVYSNHGRLDIARRLFDKMPERDLVSWNTIISIHNKHPNAVLYFDRMLDAGIRPDAITFVSMLTAYAHLRMVEDGERLFSMMEGFGVIPSMEHYACLVNLYGRAGLIDEAYKVITEKMEFAGGPTVWGALLHACCVHRNVEIGETAAEKVFDLEPDNDHNFKLLMRIYGDLGRVEDVERVRVMMTIYCRDVNKVSRAQLDTYRVGLEFGSFRARDVELELGSFKI
ncbi:hypothetical protein OSB04_026228 [Centaurea solstitialis]|uniref:adenylate kinase n=1 Tax=Centaurea solstitialis TaxID=347529 RepID=A0AA38VVF3_9ASTR|nr:hypothetical protein OSB04_026228 [Centaurea solstitialis]